MTRVARPRRERPNDGGECARRFGKKNVPPAFASYRRRAFPVAARSRFAHPPSPRGRLARRWTRDEVRRVSWFRARVPPLVRHQTRAEGAALALPPRDHLVFPDATSDGRAIHQRGVAGLHHRAARPISRGENEFSVGFSPGDVREGGRGGDVGGEASAGVDVEDEGVRSSSRAHATDDGARARDVSRRRRRGREHARARGIARERGNFSTVHIARDGSYREHFQSRVVVERVKRISSPPPSSSSSSASNIRRGVREARTSNATVAFDAASTPSSARHSHPPSGRGRRRLLPRRTTSPPLDRVAVTNGRPKVNCPRATTVSTRGPVDGDVRDEVQTNVSSTEEAVHAGTKRNDRGDASLAAASITNGRGTFVGVISSKRTPPGRSPRRTLRSDRDRRRGRLPRGKHEARRARSATGVGERERRDGRPGRAVRARRARARGAGARGEARVSESRRGFGC